MLVSVPIAQLSPAETEGETELEALSRLSQAGFGLAPLRLLRAESEEQFYRLNNLPAQLSALFADLDLHQGVGGRVGNEFGVLGLDRSLCGHSGVSTCRWSRQGHRCWEQAFEDQSNASFQLLQ